MSAKDTVIKMKWMDKSVQESQDKLLLKQAEISFEAGIREVMAELSRLAIGSGDLNLQSYVVGLLFSLSEKYGKPN